MALRKLLVTGATGKQGGAVIEALLARSSPFDIIALTRNKSSPAAQALASKRNVTVFEGDLSNVEPIFAAHKRIYGVFCVTPVEFGKENLEEVQGKAVIDAAIKHDVEHFVLTSVDRGGDKVSDTNPTNIPHFMSKHNVELYLKKRLNETGSKMQWTILRPTAFFEIFTPDFMGKGFSAMWATLGDKPLQLISCHDIGVFAARAFLDPDAYRGRAVSLAGDELTIVQGRKVFKEAMGYAMPETFSLVASGLLMLVKELKLMFAWFKEGGYGANVSALREEEPELQDFGKWLKESSKFSKRK